MCTFLCFSQRSNFFHHQKGRCFSNGYTINFKEFYHVFRHSKLISLGRGCNLKFIISEHINTFNFPQFIKILNIRIRVMPIIDKFLNFLSCFQNPMIKITVTSMHRLSLWFQIHIDISQCVIHTFSYRATPRHGDTFSIDQ